MSNWSERYTTTEDENLKFAKYKYIRHNNKTGKWEIWQESTGKTLSTHDSKEKAEAAFRAMESHMHS
jgi:sarcosine oxidase delta subunit